MDSDESGHMMDMVGQEYQVSNDRKMSDIFTFVNNQILSLVIVVSLGLEDTF